MIHGSQHHLVNQDAYRAAPSIAARFPKVGEFALELDFHDPTGALSPSSFRRVFAPSMQAFFSVPCVARDCIKGGFDLGAPVSGMLSDARAPRTATARCHGRRAKTDSPCGLELRFRLTHLHPEKAR